MRRLLLFLALCPCMTVLGQSPPQHQPGPIRFQHQNAWGLQQTSAILQDHEGYMWFGQIGGKLFRLDGQSFAWYTHNPYDSLSLSPGAVTALYEDVDDVLWVGKQTGLNRFDRETETFRRYLHDPEDPTSIAAGMVLAILEDRRGRFWTGTDGGLNLMERETGTFTRYVPDSVNTPIYDLLETRDGTLWSGSWGLCRFDPSTGTFTRYLPYPAIPEPIPGNVYASRNWVRTVHEDAQGRLWVGTVSGGIYRFDPGSESFVNFRHDPSRPIPYGDFIYAMEDDPKGGIWVATQRGLLWLDPDTGAITTHLHDPLDPYSLSGNGVMSLYRDRQDIFWVGTYFGDVDRFDRAAQPFTQYYAVPGRTNSLPFAHVQSITDSNDGTVWVLTDDNEGRFALTALDRKTGTFTSYPHNPWGSQIFSINDFGARFGPLTIYADHAGTVWVGGASLGRMDPNRPGRFTHFTHDPSDPHSLGPGWVVWFFEDSKDRLWVGTHDGLSRVDDRQRGRFTRFHLDDGIGTVNNIHEDSSGRLWISSYFGGLFRLDPETGAVDPFLNDPNSLTPNEVFGIWERPQEPGVLWLGMMPVGLGRFDPSTGSFRLYTTADGLPDNNAQGVLGDEDGNLWISTDLGLSRFDPDTGVFTNFELDDGLQGESFTAWSYHKSRWTGELFFGGPNGLNAFFPRLLRNNPHPPQVALTALSIDGHRVQPGPDGPLLRRLQETEALTLTHRQNDLAIDFVALHFRQPDKNWYTHRLVGYDDGWSDTTTTVRRAAFTNLPPGDYTFEVSAANADGVWTENPRSLQITILPPWWRTWWAYGIYLLFAIGSAIQGHRWQHARLVAREREAARERELAQAREIERQHKELTAAHETLKSTQAQLVQSEKLASLGHLTAGIAHELKNPLNFVNNFAELNEDLAREARDALRTEPQNVDPLLADLESNARQIARHGKRADAIVASMMAHAISGSGERLVVEVNDFVAEYVRLANGAFATRRPDFEVRIEEDFDPAAGSIRMAPQELGRALVNVISNAFDAVRKQVESEGEGYAPTVSVSTRRTEGAVEIRVGDNGVGIPEDVLPRVFEPFFTTKPTGEGTGLGLSLAHDIVVQGHGGSIEVESVEGNGATFVMALPANKSE